MQQNLSKKRKGLNRLDIREFIRIFALKLTNNSNNNYIEIMMNKKQFDFNTVKENYFKKSHLVSSIRQNEFNDFNNSFDYPYQKDKVKSFWVEDGGLSKGSSTSYITYLNNLLKEDITENKVLQNEELTLAEVIVLLPCIFSVDKNHELGKKTIELLCERLAPAANKKNIRNARSALRKYGLFLENYPDYDSIPNVNSKIKGILQSINNDISFSYDELYDKLDWSMWTQDRLKPSIKGYCYPIRLIGSLLNEEEKNDLMKDYIDNIIIYLEEGEREFYVSNLREEKRKLQLRDGYVYLVGKDKNGNKIKEKVYDCDGEELKAYVGSDISIEHEYSIANVLEEDYMNDLNSLKGLSKLIWEICEKHNISVTNSNAKEIYKKLREEKKRDLNNLKDGLIEDFKKILSNKKIKLSLMNTAKNSSKGKHD